MTVSKDTDHSAFIKEHTELGGHKAVSVLSMKQIHELFEGGVEEYVQLVLAKGNEVHICEAPEAVFQGGSVHAYDFGQLERILTEYEPVLTETGWPREPEKFVARLAREWVEDWHPFTPIPAIMTVIWRAFGVSDEFIEWWKKEQESPEYIAGYKKLHGMAP